MTIGAELLPKEPEVRELWRLRGELVLGNPVPYIERYFKIKDIRGQLVPMELRPLQRRYHEAIFGGGWERGKPREAVFVKPRKAYVTSYCAAIETANFFEWPGCDVVVIANHKDTLTPISDMVNTFYANMPEYAKPEIYNQVWGTERRQVVFRDPGSGQTVINTMVMSSSQSPDFGRGFTIRFVHYSEKAYFEGVFDASALEGSVGGSAIFFHDSTANGEDRHFYPVVQAAKRHEKRSHVYIFYEWWHNPENWYGSEDENRRTADVGELAPGVAEGLPALLVRDEPFLAIKILEVCTAERGLSGYLAFRRRKLGDSLASSAQHAPTALSKFHQEFPEDDVRPFSSLVNPVFDGLILDQQLEAAGRGLVVESWTDKGMAFRAWRKPVPGHSYAGGLDYSAMKGRDAACLMVKDLSEGEYVAELYGTEGNTVPDVTRLACRILRTYNEGLLIPETNNMGRTQGNFAHRDLGYPRVYMRPRKPGESSEEYQRARAAGKIEYGFETTADARTDMVVAGQTRFNAGAIRILIPELLKDMRAWNPERPREGVDGTKKHFPDRLSAFFLVEVVNPPADKSALYGLASQTGKAEGSWRRPLVMAGTLPGHVGGGY